MKLICSVSVGVRLQSNIPGKVTPKHLKSTLALCKNPKSTEYCIILFTSKNTNGTKYDVKNNILQVLTRFVNEGKTTIQFKSPPHDLFIKADAIPLKGFLHLFKRVLENKVSDKEMTLSSMAVTAVNTKNIAPKKLVIQNRSDYPMIKGFPRTLEVLYINSIKRCSVDLGIMRLTKLRLLDLSDNLIETIPVEINNLNLSEINLSSNQLGVSAPVKWEWIGGNLSTTLKLLNLRNNNLIFLPDQLVRLRNLITLNIDDNELTQLPSGIGNLRQLKIFTASNNKISDLPGSVVKLRLQSLDLSNNSFDPNYQYNPAAIFPKPLSVCTLREYSARKVLLSHLTVSAKTLPLTVIKYLHLAKYCVCGKACFDVYIKHFNMYSLLRVTQSIVSSSSEVINFVPIDCYFCSIKCFSSASFNRNRAPLVR